MCVYVRLKIASASPKSLLWQASQEWDCVSLGIFLIEAQTKCLWLEL